MFISSSEDTEDGLVIAQHPIQQSFSHVGMKTLLHGH